MMRKLSEKWRRFWRKALQVLGVTGTALIFQAGYGQLQVDYVNGIVKSGATNEPLNDIKVTLSADNNDLPEMEAVTDEDGRFWFSVSRNLGAIYILEFEESGEEGQFKYKRVIYRRGGSPLEIVLDER